MAGFLYFTVHCNILKRRKHDFKSVAHHLSENFFDKHHYLLSLGTTKCKPPFLLEKKEKKHIFKINTLDVKP